MSTAKLCGVESRLEFIVTPSRTPGPPLLLIKLGGILAEVINFSFLILLNFIMGLNSTNMLGGIKVGRHGEVCVLCWWKACQHPTTRVGTLVLNKVT